MRIEVTPRRKLITQLYEAEDYAGLSQLGLILLSTKNKSYDCGYYVLEQLKLPLLPQLIVRMRSSPSADKPFNGAIVVYSNEHGPRHYGIMRDNLVESKWGHGPAIRHNIEDVPIIYGDIVTFHIVDMRELYILAQNIRQGIY